MNIDTWSTRQTLPAKLVRAIARSWVSKPSVPSYRLREALSAQFSDGLSAAAPGHPYRTFRIAKKRAADICLSAEEWAAASASHEGSWWIPWAGWLTQNSGAERAAPPKLGAPEKGYPVLEVAPGSYVLQR